VREFFRAPATGAINRCHDLHWQSGGWSAYPMKKSVASQLRLNVLSTQHAIVTCSVFR
jgi:hypothetical protein